MSNPTQPRKDEAALAESIKQLAVAVGVLAKAPPPALVDALVVAVAALETATPKPDAVQATLIAELNDVLRRCRQHFPAR